ncbi:type II toxin-antitoxin system PemK/MazF family toxin [Arthrobacter cryoconiti]|uniref:Type II toxin-antitoxin system PemK/MazF family toxin n=1 Tax=Arthrobacter cryoconiti TaxID=748907 RepID=A0ABV8QWH5_9MICC|nr:type II toxin-antitoxin system PemK/MazF family toxin [Arthrobacter cryoconiti]MCC9069491.1 type II toxin-antitoxin system PemK/MazF family toxin [Arthrobacter cryoconiti]
MTLLSRIDILGAMASTSKRLFSLLRGLAESLLKAGTSAAPKRSAGSQAPRPLRRPASTSPGRKASGNDLSPLSSPYPGDFKGTGAVVYSPHPDGKPDPGEIVWTWVPFEEDYSQGKDRPVLLIAHNGKRLLGLMLTSKDHSNDHRDDNDYLDIGTGPWDRAGRPSEVKLDRVIQINMADVRREGAILDAKRFSGVANVLRTRYGWK